MKLILVIVLTLGLLIAALSLYGHWSFQRKLSAARDRILAQPKSVASNEFKKIQEEDLSALPPPVQQWLKKSGVIGKDRVRLTRLKQTGMMRLKPEQKEWTPSESEQLIDVSNPAFVWNVKMSVNGLPVLGMDQFYHGEGSMLITLLGLFPIVNVSHQPKISQSALQRFLGEVIWTPSAALHPSIEWMTVDSRTAKARMTVDGTSGEATFFYSEAGDLEKFVAMRFKDVTDEKPTEWHADIKETKVLNGFRIPTSVEATWILPEGPFTWFRFDVNEIQYE